jgi:hypothetical protein
MKVSGSISNLQAAMRYAAFGVPIFPCGPDKRPLMAEWLTNASADEQTIRSWWQARPDALIALPLKLLDLVVIDADRHKEDEDGIKTLRSLCAKHGELPPHPWATTANNGEHHYFRQPAGEKIGNRKIAPGLETRGFKLDNDGGFIIASGSQLGDGRRWWRGEGSPSLLESYKAGSIPTAPAWLLNGLRKEPRRRAQTGNPALANGNLIPQIGIGLMSGQWGTFKTFTVFDLTHSVMTGEPFLGCEIMRRGGVLFVALEGMEEVPVRLQGVIDHKGKLLERAPFAWVTTCPPLTSKDAAEELGKIAREVAERLKADFCLPLSLIAIDQWSRRRATRRMARRTTLPPARRS